MDFHSQSPEWQAPLTIHQPPAPASPNRPAPTSAPKSNSTPEKRLKLRASCDACAASKVKCSKEHPVCARCKTNRSQCIYGVSRKHGKPGRTRKRNPDGTPFVKASKQRPSPDGSEFSKFRVRPEPLNHSDALFDASAQWSPTPSWSSNTDFEFEMTPEPMFLEPTTDFAFMDNSMLPTTPPELNHIPMIQPELNFVDPFARKQSVMLDLPNIQAIKEFVGTDAASAPPTMSYSSLTEQMPMGANNFSPPLSTTPSATASPQSTSSTSPFTYNPLRVSISMPSSHCCYTLAYSTLESLRIINPENSTGVELKSLDSVLSITKSAVANVRQLLTCSCSSDPHLAMLYSSITSKILTWYQIAAGVKPASLPSAPPSLSDTASSPSSSVFGSPLSTPGAEHTTFDIQVKPLKIGLFEFDEEQQAMLRRQVVLRELKKCGTLVDALINWSGGENAGVRQQSQFLYDVLGTWLKTELLKTLHEVEGDQVGM